MRASCGTFRQIFKLLIPRTDFERLVKETGADYRSKGLSNRSQSTFLSVQLMKKNPEEHEFTIKDVKLLSIHYPILRDLAR